MHRISYTQFFLILERFNFDIYRRAIFVIVTAMNIISILSYAVQVSALGKYT